MADSHPLLYARAMMRNGQSGVVTIVIPEDGYAYIHYDKPAETVQGNISGMWVRIDSKDYQIIEQGQRSL